ncbi:hypothetical protein QIH87_50130 (plasmid) [Bradyrhizobium elkanii]|uniref:hypothetical protein n=1 Tax=Bradyrhizobium elkanii TaxID=29448 RepID=UPI002714D162|nr:hypothetical protein [Bradyrhizobium elkanii]WLB14791.1 hypothetical protein QIH87_50130 [Bradyrhizobium elkanii]WLB69118.1 hypothetical protein QIH89_27790 [Bradyrhizobium elkanii]
MNVEVPTRDIVQHIDDIQIPDIEITEGWAAKDVHSPADCDDAFAYLMSAIAQIEFQIDIELTKPKSVQDQVWTARARCALKYKRAALQIVQQRRGYIAEADKRSRQEARDRKLLEYIRAVVPDRQFLEWVRASNIEADDHSHPVAA